jgi:hypothetical protein
MSEQAATGFVFTSDWSYPEDLYNLPFLSITKYRIVKRTSKRIYVDRDCVWKDREPANPPMCFVLDRKELEQNGVAKGKRLYSWREDFYATLELCLARHRERSEKYRDWIQSETLETSQYLESTHGSRDPGTQREREQKLERLEALREWKPLHLSWEGARYVLPYLPPVDDRELVFHLGVEAS